MIELEPTSELCDFAPRAMGGLHLHAAARVIFVCVVGIYWVGAYGSPLDCRWRVCIPGSYWANMQELLSLFSLGDCHFNGLSLRAAGILPCAVTLDSELIPVGYDL